MDVHENPAAGSREPLPDSYERECQNLNAEKIVHSSGV
jgi:hypothetical protein